MLGKSVVVTGIGIVSPLGVGANHCWESLLAGRSGIKALGPQYSQLPVRIAGTVPEGSSPHQWDPNRFCSPKLIRNSPKFCQYAISAAKLALEDAEYEISTNQHKSRTGVAIGSGIGGVESCYNNSINFHNHGIKKVSPHFVPSLLPNMASGHVSIETGAAGPNHSVSTACTTGAHSIGDASNFIRLGMADVMIAGSSESAIHPISIAGFSRAKSLTTNFQTSPEAASRPFDKSRSGFVISEGACVLILESLDHALQRNARIYASVDGYGLSGDAGHITAPLATGDGAYRCMQMAVEQAQLTPSDIGYINAHATSTILGDKAESNAIDRLFGNHKVAVSSTKGSTGHLLGASGSLEAAFTVLSLYSQTLPPSINLDEPLSNLNFVKSAKPVTGLNHVISNSFGFGGTNASLLFSRYL